MRDPLVVVIVRSVRLVHDITEHKRAEQDGRGFRRSWSRPRKWNDRQAVRRHGPRFQQPAHRSSMATAGLYAGQTGRGRSAASPGGADPEGRGTGSRASTRQLLAFSRKQVLEPRTPGSQPAWWKRCGRGCERLAGEDVEVRVTLSGKCGLGAARIRHQLEQVIMNLAVNARDAMPDRRNTIDQDPKSPCGRESRRRR